LRATKSSRVFFFIDLKHERQQLERAKTDLIEKKNCLLFCWNYVC
jgi:hypothetical protein